MRSYLLATGVLLLIATASPAQAQPSVDFEDPAVLNHWIGVTEDRHRYSKYYASAFEHGASMAFQGVVEDADLIVVRREANYGFLGSTSGPIPVSRVRAQVSQNPATFQDMLSVGYAFLEHPTDSSKRAIAHFSSSRGLSIQYNRTQDQAQEFAESIIARVETKDTVGSPFKSAALELKEAGQFGFLPGVDSYSYDWDQFIFDAAAKDQIRNRIDNFIGRYDRELWSELGLPMKRGVLLYGPPGTGKSFIGKILISNVIQNRYANDVTFIQVQARHVISKTVIRKIYNLARVMNPAIVFIEDIDLIAGTNRENRQEVKNELMQQLSGIERLEGVITLATTNLGDEIDAALLRHGRLGFHFEIGKPSLPERIALFQLFSGNLDTTGIDFTNIATHSEGMTGADIKQSIAIATEFAIRENSISGSGVVLTNSHIDQAMRFQQETRIVEWED